MDNLSRILYMWSELFVFFFVACLRACVDYGSYCRGASGAGAEMVPAAVDAVGPGQHRGRNEPPGSDSRGGSGGSKGGRGAAATACCER